MFDTGFTRGRFMSLGSPFGPGAQAGPSMGQALYQQWEARARAVLSSWNQLLDRTSQIGNAAARSEILDWISRSDVPGTPAERYDAVAKDVQEGAFVTPVAQQRIVDLENMARTLETKVKNAETAYASIATPDQPGMVVDFRGAFTPTGFVLGAVVILGLLVVPLVVAGE